MYNDLGNLIEKNIETSNFSTPDYNDDIWDYTYDAYNRVTSIYRDDNVSHKVGEYKFNMLGNRVQKKTYDEYWQLDDTIKMLYDGYDCVADYNDADNLLRHYITPGLDENVLVYDVDNTEEYFYLHDGLGTVRQIINNTQTIENNYDYEGFGTSISHSENIYNRYRYTGREYDKETESDPTYNSNEGTKDGLYYYRARTYDSTIGSFTSRDPIPYANLYPYCSSNPITYTDPLGLICSYNARNCKELTGNEQRKLQSLQHLIDDSLREVEELRERMQFGLLEYDAYARFADKPLSLGRYFEQKILAALKESKKTGKDPNYTDTDDMMSNFSTLESLGQLDALLIWYSKTLNNINDKLKDLLVPGENMKCKVKCKDTYFKKNVDAQVEKNSKGECRCIAFRMSTINDLMAGKDLQNITATLIHESNHYYSDEKSSFNQEICSYLLEEVFLNLNVNNIGGIMDLFKSKSKGITDSEGNSSLVSTTELHSRLLDRLGGGLYDKDTIDGGGSNGNFETKDVSSSKDKFDRINSYLNEIFK